MSTNKVFLKKSHRSEYPRKFIVDPQYIGLFMILNGKFVALLLIKSPK